MNVVAREHHHFKFLKVQACFFSPNEEVVGPLIEAENIFFRVADYKDMITILLIEYLFFSKVCRISAFKSLIMPF